MLWIGKLIAVLVLCSLGSRTASAGYGEFSLSDSHYQKHIALAAIGDFSLYYILRTHKDTSRKEALIISGGVTLAAGLFLATFRQSSDSNYEIKSDVFSHAIGIAISNVVKITFDF